MSRKKYAIKYIKDMTEEQKQDLIEKTKELILPADLKSEEDILYQHLEYFLKLRKNELKKENENVIDMFDLRNLEDYLKEKKIYQVAAYPKDLVLIPETKETSNFFRKDIFAKKIKVKKGN
jgi:hypothetical protein